MDKKKTLRYFNFEPSFKLRWFHDRCLFRSQILKEISPVVPGICDRNQSPVQHHCSKKDVKWMSKYFPKPKSLGENVKTELGLSSYARKADLKNWAGVDTLDFA